LTKHYLSAYFETNKTFCNDATKAQSAGGANVFGAERQRAAALSRVRRARGGDD